LLRYLPELLRRAIQAEGELRIDKPVSLYLAERLGQTASEMSAVPSSENLPAPPAPVTPAPAPSPVSPGDVSHGQWMPSMKDGPKA